jgi:hypothetical protein
LTPAKKISVILSVILLMPCLAAYTLKGASFTLIGPADTIHSTEDTVNHDPRIAACPNFGGDEGFGQLTVGIRAGACVLLDPGSIGFGLGFCIRYRLAKQWSLEGYADRFKTSILHLGYRNEARYGLNALYYWAYRPLRIYKFTRFLLAGISYENITIYSYRVRTDQFGGSTPWLDLGIGEHYRMARHWDWTLEFFYDMPLATHPASYLSTPEVGPQFLKVRDQDAFNIGGIFGIISLNYTFGYM